MRKGGPVRWDRLGFVSLKVMMGGNLSLKGRMVHRVKTVIEGPWFHEGKLKKGGQAPYRPPLCG